MISSRTAAFTLSLVTTALSAQSIGESTGVTDQSEQIIKIRVINSSDIMQMTEVGKQEAQKIDVLGKELKDTLDKKEQLLTQTMNDFKAKSTTLTAAAREKEENKIIAMRSDLQSTGQASDEQYKHAMQRATEKLSKEIELAVTKTAQEQDLDLVLDLYTGRPVFASNRILITEDIIKTMDENFSKTKKPAAKKPEMSKAAAQKTSTPAKTV